MGAQNSNGGGICFVFCLTGKNFISSKLKHNKLCICSYNRFLCPHAAGKTNGNKSLKPQRCHTQFVKC